jgi:hypothetical protein
LFLVSNRRLWQPQTIIERTQMSRNQILVKARHSVSRHVRDQNAQSLGIDFHVVIELTGDRSHPPIPCGNRRSGDSGVNLHVVQDAPRSQAIHGDRLRRERAVRGFVPSR